LAVQLCALPWLGFLPDDVAGAPRAAVNRVALQLGIPVGGLASYGARQQTRTEHLRVVAARLRWRGAGLAEWKDLEEFLLARAIEHDAPSVLFRLGCEFLQAAKVVRPGVISLMERIAMVRQNATGEVFLRVEHLLSERRRAELDALLVVEDGMTVSRLAWLHRGATSASPMAIRGELDKLRFLRGLDAHRLDLSALPDARRRRLAGVGRRATGQALARRDEEKRFPVLLATVAECAVEVLDEIVQMFDQAISGTESRARRKLDELLAARAKTSERKLDLLEEILEVATDEAIADDEVGGRLRRGIGMDRLRAARRDPKDRLQRDHGHLALIDASFTYLREFAPHVIAALDFEASPDAASLLAAVSVLREMYAKGTRRCPRTHRRSSSRPAGAVTSSTRESRGMSPRIGTTGNCAPCSGYVTRCAQEMCGCPDPGATPTRPRFCSRSPGGKGCGRSTAPWSTSLRPRTTPSTGAVSS